MSDLLPTDSVAVPPQVLRLIEAAKTWAVFQEEDSQLDQQTDTQLYGAAEAARWALLEAVGAL